MGIVTRANSFMTKERAMGFWRVLEFVTRETGIVTSSMVKDQ